MNTKIAAFLCSSGSTWCSCRGLIRKGGRRHSFKVEWYGSPRANKGRQMKSHTQIKIFNCEGLLRSQYTKKKCIWKKCHALCTEAWEVIFCLLFPSCFLTRKTGCNYSQVWIVNKGYDYLSDAKPISTTAPQCTMSQYHWFPLLCRPGCVCRQLPQPCEWERQEKSCRTTIMWWECWCRNVTLGQFLDLLKKAFPAEGAKLPTLRCSPAGPPSWGVWDVIPREICSLLTTPSHTQNFQHTHESKQSYFFKSLEGINTCIQLAPAFYF